MRTFRQRIHHALCFELIGLLLFLPLGILVFGLTPQNVGMIGIVSSLIATCWVYVFNLLFDHALQRLYRTSEKTLVQRIINSVLFEIGLLIVLVPFIAIYLELSLWEALRLDAAVVVFYLVYSFVYNYAYDYLFPLSTPTQSVKLQ